MNNPNVVLGIHRDANGRADDPMVRKRLWPQRVHFELWRFDAGGGDGSAPLEDDGDDAEPCEKSEKGGYRDKFMLHHFPPLSGVVRRGTAVIGCPRNSQNPT